jgi:glycosyltransferase involved in cell wall biosynthesis
MNIYLDNNVFRIQEAGGVSVYWYELISRLSRQRGIAVTFINAHSRSGNIFERRLDYSSVGRKTESLLPETLLRYLPLRCTLPPASLFHSGYLRTSRQKGILNILTVHDFTHEKGLASAWPVSLLNTRLKKNSIARADGVICVSEATKRDLLQYYPDTPEDKIRVILHGISDAFSPTPHPSHYHGSHVNLLLPGLRPPYVLYVGGRQSYKQFPMAVEAVQALDPRFQLVMVGGGPLTPEEQQGLGRCLPQRHLYAGTVSDNTLNHLYQNAWCLIYPSQAEGFGFPPGEAMKAGCPVVTTHYASIPEVVGDAAIMVSEPSPSAFAQAMDSLKDPDKKRILLAKGLLRSQSLNWDRCYQETLDFYKYCYQRKFFSSP